jgi:hypothetical protein
MTEVTAQKKRSRVVLAVVCAIAIAAVAVLAVSGTLSKFVSDAVNTATGRVAFMQVQTSDFNVKYTSPENTTTDATQTGMNSNGTTTADADSTTDASGTINADVYNKINLSAGYSGTVTYNTTIKTEVKGKFKLVLTNVPDQVEVSLAYTKNNSDGTQITADSTTVSNPTKTEGTKPDDSNVNVYTWTWDNLDAFNYAADSDSSYTFTFTFKPTNLTENMDFNYNSQTQEVGVYIYAEQLQS